MLRAGEEMFQLLGPHTFCHSSSNSAQKQRLRDRTLLCPVTSPEAPSLSPDKKETQVSIAAALSEAVVTPIFTLLTTVQPLRLNQSRPAASEKSQVSANQK